MRHHRGMKHALAALLIATAGAAPAACPEAPDRTAELLDLFAQSRAAPTEVAARPLTQQMWAIWFDAPDEIAQAILDRGMSRRAAQDFLGARAEFSQLIAYCPGYAEGYNQRAFINFIGGNYEAALGDLDRAILLSPNHMGAQTGKAQTLVRLGRKSEAAALLRAALEIHPWLPERRLLADLEKDTL